jgi:peptidylprolyl isomerase
MIQQGNTVKVHYTGKLEDNQIFDSSVGKQPIEFQVGANQVIPGFENAVLGLNVGDKKEILITPEEGYGPVREELIMTLPRTQVPQDVEPGSQLQGVGQDGNPFNVIVTEVNETNVVVDANHPLSGKNMIFEIEVVEFS